MRALNGISIIYLMRIWGASDLRNCSPVLKMYCRSSLMVNQVEEAIDGVLVSSTEYT